MCREDRIPGGESGDIVRVLQFGKFYPPHIGGIEKVMYEITEGLNERGIHCDVLCSNDRNEYVEETTESHRVIRTRSYGICLSTSISPQLVFKLLQIHGDYDIIHVHLPDPMATMALFLSRPDAKVVLHWHNDIVRQRLLLKLLMPFQGWMLRRADAVVTTSPNYIGGSLHLAPYRDKCFVVPIGVEKTHLEVSQETVDRIRGNHAGKRIVFSIGRLSHYKGYKYLIEAGRYLGDDYVILIAGPGPLKGRLLRQIKEQGLADKVFLIGPIRYEEVGSYYEACDIFCLSSISRNEGFGLVQVEAMLFRKPVVSTDVKGSGITWANIHGETGLVVRPEDSRALADAIESICSDQSRYQTMAANGYRRATEQFTREKMLSSTIDLYRRILGTV
jgi:glycosyltransferase involved in cell wall biosynthesis